MQDRPARRTHRLPRRKAALLGARTSPARSQRWPPLCLTAVGGISQRSALAPWFAGRRSLPLVLPSRARAGRLRRSAFAARRRLIWPGRGGPLVRSPSVAGGRRSVAPASSQSGRGSRNVFTARAGGGGLGRGPGRRRNSPSAQTVDGRPTGRTPSPRQPGRIQPSVLV